MRKKEHGSWIPQTEIQRSLNMTLSIIVPVYNLENYISRTLDSLLNIECSFDYEIIVINDGSTDQSEKIISKYQDDYKCIKLFTIANGGVSNARNFGLSRANGKYITFVDGDDTVEPDFFEAAVNELEQNGYDFVQGNFRIINGETISYAQRVHCDIELDSVEDMLVKFFYPSQKIIHNVVWDKVFRGDILVNKTFDLDLKVSEDQKFIFDVIICAKKVKLLSLFAINYFQRDSSAIHNLDIDKTNNKLQVIEYCKNQITSKDIIGYLDWHELHVLIELYSELVIGGYSVKKVRKKIFNIEVNSIKGLLDTRMKIILFFIKYTNIYKIFILNKSRRGR